MNGLPFHHKANIREEELVQKQLLGDPPFPVIQPCPYAKIERYELISILGIFTYGLQLWKIEQFIDSFISFTLESSFLLPSLFLFVALLLTAQLHIANQLSAWCLHFISSNYTAFSSKPEFSRLTGDNILEHQWLPVSYLEAMEEYRKKYEVDKSEDPFAVGGRGRSSERCSLM